MPVTTIPYGQDLRRPRAMPSKQSAPILFIFDEDDFPELPHAFSFTPVSKDRKVGTSVVNANAKVQDVPVRVTAIPAPVEALHTSFNKFLELPTEIRELIEKEAMLAGGHFTYDLFVQGFVQDDSPSNPQRPGFLPALCSVWKSTFLETTRVFLRDAKIVISNYGSNLLMSRFLNHVQGFCSIRNIALPYFDFFPGVGNTKFGQYVEKNSDLALVAQCSGLRVVKISMSVKNLRKLGLKAGHDHEDGLDSISKTVPELVAFYDLEKIFSCEGLRKIYWDGRSHYGVEAGTEGDLRGVLHDLASWVEERFRTKGKEQKHFKCVVTWR